jgi:HCOMODA/2-hydroxy-3-carboxy-muconic semialdehyde decarboxylase
VTDLERAIRDVVIANRILANEGVVDAYGHVSVRHPLDPTRYLLSRSLAPSLVERGDVIEFDLEGKAVNGDARPPYLERFIHGAIYEARPDVQAVVHAHAEAVLPYTISSTPLRPVVHMASFIGARLPVWDIRDSFGDTNLLVVNMAQGRDLARGLGSERVVLMRGHGFTAAGALAPRGDPNVGLHAAQRAVLSEALRLGEVKALSRGEIEAHARCGPTSPRCTGRGNTGPCAPAAAISLPAGPDRPDRRQLVEPPGVLVEDLALRLDAQIFAGRQLADVVREVVVPVRHVARVEHDVVAEPSDHFGHRLLVALRGEEELDPTGDSRSASCGTAGPRLCAWTILRPCDPSRTAATSSRPP